MTPPAPGSTNGPLRLDPGARLTYRQIRWSYRRLNSYLLADAAGRPIGDIVPVDDRTSLLRLGPRPVAVLTGSRGGVVVSAPSGGELGRYERRIAMAAHRATLRVDGHRPSASLDQPWLSRQARLVAVDDGTLLAVVDRSAEARFAGAGTSWLVAGPGAALLPVAVLLAAVPAVDELHKAARRAARQ